MTEHSPTSPAGASPTSPADVPPALPTDVPPTSPAGPSSDLGADFTAPPPARRRRRTLIIAGAAGAAVLIVLVCAGFGALAAGVGRLVRESDREDEARLRVETACLALERRLNRLAPPGAAGSPGQRAAAIRDENAAVRPFLAEIEAVPGWRPDGADEDDDDRGPGGRRGWTQRWEELVDARTSYADALDRQVTNGEPAFFIAPRDAAGRPVLARLERGAESCAGAARRLAAPDL